MAIPDNYIDKITKGNDSRMISPAAGMVRVNNDNFDGETLDEVLDDVAQAIGEAGEVKSVTINGTNHTPDSSGVIDLGTVITAHQDISGKANASDVYTKTQTDTLLSGKQNTLTFDSTPTASSTKPVTSGGIKTYVDGKATITGITTSQDGTFTIALSDGNFYTVNLNHAHPQYQPLLTAGANITIATNQQTGDLEISASGGGSGGVQSSDVATIVKLADQASYEALPTKDSSTLYLIPES